MRAPVMVKVHRSGNSYALYLRKEWAKALGVSRKGVWLPVVFHRGVLVVRPKHSRNGKGPPSEPEPVAA